MSWLLKVTHMWVMSWLLKVTHMWVAFFKLLDKKFFERRRRWATREKEIKANEKNRKKASKHN